MAKNPNYSYKVMVPKLVVIVEEKFAQGIMVNSLLEVGEVISYVPRLSSLVLFVCSALKLLHDLHNSLLLKKCLVFSPYWVTLFGYGFFLLFKLVVSYPELYLRWAVIYIF